MSQSDRASPNLRTFQDRVAQAAKPKQSPLPEPATAASSPTRSGRPKRVQIITREEGFAYGQQFDVIGWTGFDQPVVSDRHNNCLLVLDPGDFAAVERVSDPPPSPSDDDLVEMMARQELAARSYYRSGDARSVLRSILARIRHLLEARGIELAAKKCKSYAQAAEVELRARPDNEHARSYFAAMHTMIGILEEYGRRHATGAK